MHNTTNNKIKLNFILKNCVKTKIINESYFERLILIPLELKQNNWFEYLTSTKSFSRIELEKITSCTFEVKMYSNEFYILVIAKNKSNLNKGVNEIENIIWNKQRAIRFKKQIEMETVPENWFQEYTIIPNEIFSLNPVTKFQKKKSLPEIVFLPTEKLGLILGKKHRTLLDIRTLTNTELKMGETEGLMTKFELWGKEENKQKAKVMLAEVMHHIPPLQPGEITKTFKLPQKLIGILIGPNGSMIKSIQSKTWCFVKVFKNSKCMLRGLPDRVEKAEYVIRKLLGIHKFISKKQSKNLENLKNYEKKQFMEIMNNKCINLFIPSKLITRVINSNIDTLETEFNVSIGLAKEINKEITRITIKGQIGGIKACKMRFDRVLGIKLKKKLNEKKLPLGWCYFNDLNTKQPYYYNRKKNIVTWNHPMSEKYKKEYLK